MIYNLNMYTSVIYTLFNIDNYIIEFMNFYEKIDGLVTISVVVISKYNPTFEVHPVDYLLILKYMNLY